MKLNQMMLKDFEEENQRFVDASNSQRTNKQKKKEGF